MGLKSFTKNHYHTMSEALSDIKKEFKLLWGAVDNISPEEGGGMSEPNSYMPEPIAEGGSEYKGPFALSIVERDKRRYIRMEHTGTDIDLTVNGTNYSALKESMLIIGDKVYYVKPLEVEVDVHSSQPERHIILRATRTLSSDYTFSLHAERKPNYAWDSLNSLEWVLGHYVEELTISTEPNNVLGTTPARVVQFQYGVITHRGSDFYSGDFTILCDPNEDGSTTVHIGYRRAYDDGTARLSESSFYVNGSMKKAPITVFNINDTGVHVFYLKYTAPVDADGVDREEQIEIVDSRSEDFVYDEESGTVLYYEIGSIYRYSGSGSFGITQKHVTGSPNLTWYYRCVE